MTRRNANPKSTMTSGPTTSSKNGTSQANNSDGEDNDPYTVNISLRFIVLTMLSCWLSSFAVGRTARQLLVVGPQLRLLELQAAIELQERTRRQEREQESMDNVMQLPNPTLKNKPVPNTVYTAMNFDTARSTSITSRFVVSEEDDSENDGVCKLSMSGKQCEVKSGKIPTGPHDQNNESIIIDEGPHYPAGQHLLMDIRNVEELRKTY